MHVRYGIHILTPWPFHQEGGIKFKHIQLKSFNKSNKIVQTHQKIAKQIIFNLSSKIFHIIKYTDHNINLLNFSQPPPCSNFIPIISPLLIILIVN